MANGSSSTKLGDCIFILIVLSHILSNRCVHGRRIATLKIKELVKHEGTIKTIKVKDGDVIDCVDIYKQPAFDHPLLKNHTIQIKPSSYPSGLKAEKSQAELLQGWLKEGQCPKGTVPIRRNSNNNAHSRAIPSIPQRNHKTEIEDSTGHEYALVSVFGGNYFGAQANINVWHPATFDGEFSLAQIWVSSGQGEERNTVEAGWMVYAGQTRFFTYWTRDRYKNTGCYDLECPGLVQTNNKFILGSAIQPVSTYGAKQFEIGIKIHKDKESGNWWLQLQDQALGYWPSSIFTSLAESSNVIKWGGEIVNSESHGHHTSTQMGSGHFANEDYGKASYFRNLGYIDNSGAVKDPENLIPYVTKPSCYDLQPANICSKRCKQIFCKHRAGERDTDFFNITNMKDSCQSISNNNKTLSARNKNVSSLELCDSSRIDFTMGAPDANPLHQFDFTTVKPVNLQGVGNERVLKILSKTL